MTRCKSKFFHCFTNPVSDCSGCLRAAYRYEDTDGTIWDYDNIEQTLSEVDHAYGDLYGAAEALFGTFGERDFTYSRNADPTPKIFAAIGGAVFGGFAAIAAGAQIFANLAN